MNEQEHLHQVAQIMSDDTPVTVNITIKDLWMMDSALSLSYRHPGINDMTKAWFLHVSVQIRAAIIDRYPEAARLLEMGWHEENDVPIDYDRQKRMNETFQEILRKRREKGQLP